jgi:hypothetical protein
MDFAPGKPFQPSLLFAGKTRSLPLSEEPERRFTWVGYCLTCKHYSIPERLARDEHSSLLQKNLTCGRKKFYNIGPRFAVLDILIPEKSIYRYSHLQL